MNYKRVNYIIGLSILCLCSLVYLFTMQPTLSFWDCGEFAACAYTLSVPHPPGAPFWTIIGRVATLFPFGANPAVKINAVSAISSGFTVFFLYLTIVIVIRNWRGEIKNNWDAILVYGAATIGALSYAFCDSFWFNALEAEVYAFGTMLMILCVWLLFYWWENSDRKGIDRVFLLTGFIIGLALGIHLLVVQVILIAGLLFYFKKYSYTRKSLLIAFLITCGIFLIVYPIVVIWYPTWLSGDIRILKISNNTIVKWIGILFIPAIFFGIIYFFFKGKKIFAFALTFIFLIIAGYSIYTTVLLRANVHNLPINENNPSSFQSLVSYLNREQYGNAPFLPRRYSNEPMHRRTWSNYSSDLDFLWRYQVNHLFTRYLGWQYIGRAGYEQDAGIDWSKFYGIPFIIGLIGLFYHFRKDWKLGLVLLWMFLLMGILTALFQRQQDPQPRERDYFYEGAFFVYSLWIGLGVFGTLELIKNGIKNYKTYQVFGIVFLLAAFVFVPLNMFRVNFHYQNRANNYVPFDYAYNILQSVDKDGILFTIGDNDTFPLWYLQAIGYRQDVRVINLNLLNLDWYIKEQKNSSPYGALKVPINISDEQIEQIQPAQWGDYKTLTLPVPHEAYPDSIGNNTQLPDKLTWRMPATFNASNNIKAVRISDLMTLEIIKTNNWQRPIFFSNTVTDEYFIGLGDYLVNEGMAKKLVPYKDESGTQFRTDDIMYKNLMSGIEIISKTPAYGFSFRNLNNKTLFFDQITTNIIQNYRSQYLLLAYSLYNKDNDLVGAVLDKMEENLPKNVIPMDYRVQHNVAMLYSEIGSKEKFMELSKDVEIKALEELKKNPNDFQTPWNPYKLLLDIYETREDYQNALDIVTKLDKIAPGSSEIKMKIDVLKEKINGNYNQ